MNNSDRKALARAFSAAKERLSPTRVTRVGKHEFICHALCGALCAGKITERICRMARAIVGKRLEGRSTLSGWLAYDAGIPHADIRHDRIENMGRQTQITRAAWLDSLIAEFSSPA